MMLPITSSSAAAAGPLLLATTALVASSVAALPWSPRAPASLRPLTKRELVAYNPNVTIHETCNATQASWINNALDEMVQLVQFGKDCKSNWESNPQFPKLGRTLSTFPRVHLSDPAIKTSQLGPHLQMYSPKVQMTPTASTNATLVTNQTGSPSLEPSKGFSMETKPMESCSDAMTLMASAANPAGMATIEDPTLPRRTTSASSPILQGCLCRPSVRKEEQTITLRLPCMLETISFM